MATRDLTSADLARSTKNGNGNGTEAGRSILKPMPGGRRARTRAPAGQKKNAPLPGRQIKTETDRWFGNSAVDQRRQGLGQDKDTIAAIKAIRDLDAQASHAVWNYLRLINPGHDIKAYIWAPDGSEIPEDGPGQREIDSWAARVGGEYGGGTDQLHNVLALVLLTNGACALEVEINGSLTDIIDWHPIDPQLLTFHRVKDDDGVERLHLGQDAIANASGNAIGMVWTKVNESTIFYQPLDPDIDDPYGRPPLVAAVGNVLFLAQLHADLRAMAHQQGFPRLDVSVVWEAIQNAAPSIIRDDPAAFQEWATAQLNSIVADYEDLAIDDTFIHYDFVNVGTAGGGAGAFAFEALDKILTRRVTMSLKALPITLGINDSTSETHGSIQWQIQVAGVENFQKVIKRLLEKAANVSLRLKGIQAHAKVEYEEIRTVDRLYEAQSDFFDRRNAQFDVQMGWIDNDEAATRIVGHVAEGQPGPASGVAGSEPQPPPEQGEDEPWWASLFADPGTVQPGAGADGSAPGQGSQVENQPGSLPGSTADPGAAWKLLLQENRQAAAPAGAPFVRSSATRTIRSTTALSTLRQGRRSSLTSRENSSKSS